ncbi:M28 family metallopeptidase [Clostridium sp. AL.422]|uniref:M28 family metallopeptidase n=1 Tax=Clostridium TaxID=1485 RepID=UPI00293DBFF7|nr:MULTISPECIES: M28 family metallopeptidase [unclassified Clostridium]MDV4151616.1 M28 family metallopeptidase [Clostridium sp. AL.422]
MKKKLFYYLSLVTTLVLLSLSIFSNFTYSPFDADNVKQSIAILSSDTYGGRLAGSKENSLVEELIRKNFQDNKLTPLNDNYKESFKVISPINNNTNPYLKISYDDGYQESLKYGVDFKEDMINFKNTTLTFSNEDKIIIFSNYIEVETDDGKFLFYLAPNNNFSFRSSFISEFPYNMMVLINTESYNKILNSLREGAEISVNIPFSTEEKEISNIVGVIEGTSKELPPLVLTAHFDHLGKDALKNVYGGALDNASGISFILEIQRVLTTYGKPKRDIIFVALNAEEFGLLGSKSFAQKNIDKLKGAEVINFDMIGSDGFPLTLMMGQSYKDKESDLLNSITKIAKDNNIETKVAYENSSDHASFNELGIESLSFCHSDLSKIHTPEDTVNYISVDAIDSAYSIIEDKILDSSYGIVTKFFYGKTSIFIFSVLFSFLASSPFITYLKKRKIK